ncbi:MAG: hypothetical protein LAN59_02970 [Acidobacteriia bacterium]|nr:hypothetical protein [Terriglobia bacterium]
MRRLLVTLCAFLPLLAGCSGVPADPPIQVVITNPFPSDAIQVGAAPYTLHATVTNDPQGRGVIWSLTQANTNCSPDCGTLVSTDSPSFGAIYTPPSVAPQNQQVNLSAISVANHQQLYSFIFTIIPPIAVSITNKFDSTVASGPAVVVNASVLHDAAGAGVTWALTANGATCSPACGTLQPAAAPSFSARYTPSSTTPAGANASPTITATSVTNSSASDSCNFTVRNPLSLFKGHFAFVLRGYDLTGAPTVVAGSVNSDGNGNITDGEIDYNNDGGILNIPAPTTGTYTVDNSFNGTTKVVLEISSFTFPGTNIDLKFRFFLSADGQRGRMIEIDGSGFLNAGTIQLQDSSALGSKPSGNFAFGLDSDAPVGGRVVSVGQLVLGSSGITGGTIDQSEAGAASPIYAAAPISPASVAAPDANGRGTFDILVNGIPSQYAYYIVDSAHFLLIQIDRGLQTGTVQTGKAIAQKTLTADSVNATSVLQLTGMDEPTGTSTVGPAVIIGVLSTSSGNAFSLTFDSNDIGTILTSHLASGSIASFDPATGRAVLSSPGGFNSGFVDSAVMYLYDQAAGFFIDTDISTPPGTPVDQTMTNNAWSGTFVPRIGSSFTAQSLSSNTVAGFGGSAAPTVPNFDLGVTLNSSAGTYVAAGDLNSLPSQDNAATDFQFSGTFQILNSSLGHGVVTLPASFFGDFTSGTTVKASFYMIAPNQFVLIGVQSGLYSGVAFFDPQ